ncbi:MAG: type II toxin-antitoxin system VapC family toxin [Acetobacteraceae bacterium]
MTPLLLDTCAAIWLMQKAPMSQASLDAIRAAQRAHAGIFVSPISAWEIATLVRKGRITLNRPPEVWFDTLLGLPGIRLADMPPRVLIDSSLLPGAPPRDPADRIIAATARAYGYRIVTRDGELVPYAASGHVDVIAC